MPILHLGVIDVPYVENETPAAQKKRIKKAAPKSSEHMTTGDVAEIIEQKYHPMEIFWELHGQQCADKMAEGLVGAMENLLVGAPLTIDPFAEAEGFIDSEYKNFINTGELETLGYPGVPTKAAIERKSSRFKSNKGKNQRPSLVNTGLYIASFKSEIEE